MQDDEVDKGAVPQYPELQRHPIFDEVLGEALGSLQVLHLSA